MSRGAWIQDLQSGAVIKLPLIRTTLVIGLTPTDELLCSAEDVVQQSEIVLDLYSIRSTTDGYWLIPSAYLPTSLNDCVISGHVLLKQGAIIGVGDRLMRFSMDTTQSDDVTDRAPTPDQCTGLIEGAGPTPGVMTSHSRDIMDIPVACSGTFDPSVILKAIMCDVSVADRSAGPTADGEVLAFLSTSQGLANMTAAIVSQHVALHTVLRLRAHEVDCLFLSFEHITAWEERCFQTFLYEYEELFSKPAVHDVTTQTADFKRPFCIHTPVIHLLTDLLKLTLDPIEYNILWLRILAELSLDDEALSALVRYKTAAAVLGCMSATRHVSALQQHGCRILAGVSAYKPAHGEKGPLREGGIQLIVQALQHHMSCVDVVKPAISCLSKLLQTYSTLAMETVSSMQFVPLEVQRTLLVVVMGVLDFIEEMAVPVIATLPESHLTDDVIRNNVIAILSYFHDHMDELNRSSGEEFDDSGTSEATNTERMASSACPRHGLSVKCEPTTSSDTQPTTNSDTLPNKSSDIQPITSCDAQPTTRKNAQPITDKDIQPMTDGKTQPIAERKIQPTTENTLQTISDRDIPDNQRITNESINMTNTANVSKPGQSPPQERIRDSDAPLPSDRPHQPIISAVEFFSDDEDSSIGHDSKVITKTRREIGEQNMDAVCDLSDSNNMTSASTSAGTEQQLIPESAQTSPPIQVHIHKVKALPKKRTNIFEKLKRTKPKKSMISTEYTQTHTSPPSTPLKSSSSSRGTVQGPPLNHQTQNISVNRTDNDASVSLSLQDQTLGEDMRPPSPHQITSEHDGAELRPGLDVNVSRYAKIFSRMSKKNKQKTKKKEHGEESMTSPQRRAAEDHTLTDIDASSRANGHHNVTVTDAKSDRAAGGFMANFMRRTRKVFKDGKGQYDMTEAVRMSYTEEERVSNLPLSMQDLGHTLDLSNTGRLSPDVLY